MSIFKIKIRNSAAQRSFHKKLLALSLGERKSVRQLWLVWLCASVIIFLIQSWTVDILPCIQQDEAQITEYGRLALHPYSDWSIIWLLKDGKPLMLWSYLGPLIAETGYQTVGTYGVGPRIVALFGGLVAAAMALGWLASRKVPLFAAGLLSLAFLIDPLFVLSQRMARVDSWVIACCLASCWLLRIAAMKQKAVVWIAVAGGLAATALLIWPSALFLFPLVLLELFHMFRVRRINGDTRKRILCSGLYFIAGGLFFLVLLLVPIWKSIFIMWSDVAKMVSLNTVSTTPLQERLFALFNYHHWFKLAKVLLKTLTPFFPIVALLSLFYRQKKELIFVVLLTLALMFATLVYEFRALYLLPYFLVMAGTIFLRIREGQLGPFKVRLGLLALYVLLFWSAGISLFMRSFLTVSETGQDRSRLYQAARMSIGQGNHRVFLAFTYEFYFPGRSLGWALYTPYPLFTYDEHSNWHVEDDFHQKEKFRQLLSKMDYAIFPQSMINAEVSSQLAECGLQRQRILNVGHTLNKTTALNSNNRYWNMVMWYLLGKKECGPYLLYGRLGTSTAGR